MQNQHGQDILSIAVTGIGVCCPIGQNAAQLMDSIRNGRGGIGVIRSFSTANQKIRHAAEIIQYDPDDHFSKDQAAVLDRTAQFAIVAARQAVQDSDLNLLAYAPERIGLIAGVCAGGQGKAQTDPDHNAQDFLNLAQYIQTGAVGSMLGLHGPCATISTACASSATALAYAYELLQAGKVDVVIAGGADAFSFHTYAGFYALGAMSTQPSSPFSESVGVSFGEGAGFVVLEPVTAARQRNATVYGELSGYGSTGDAYHITTPQPAGEGLHRAMRNALSMAGLPLAEVDYINAHGTGTRDNDTAETLAVKDLCRDMAQTPPMSSTKSFFGHTLGAAGILEFITSMLCQNDDVIPPTLNFESPRAGCDLDYVPNKARPGRIRHFLSSSAAFGGVNTVLAGSSPAFAAGPRRRETDSIVVTGLGIVSPVGCGVEAFRQALIAKTPGAEPITRFDTAGLGSHSAALVRDFKPRQMLASLDVRRMDRLNQYAGVAAGLAYRDACLETLRIHEERIGVVAGLTRGPVGTQENFLDSLRRDGLENLSAKYFPSMVISTVAGQISQALHLKALNSTLVDGASAGLHAIIHGAEMLRQNDTQDALVVVAADEVGAMFFKLFEKCGMLADDSRPYDAESPGTILGEGAVALVLERAGSASRRGARVYGRISGYGLTSDSEPGGGLEQGGVWLTRAMELALAEAGLDACELDFCYGQGRGLSDYDLRELRAWERLFGDAAPPPLGCVTGNVGFAEAASGAYGVAAALLGLHYGEVYPLASPGAAPPFVQDQVLSGIYQRAMVAGGSEIGNNAAIVIERLSTN